MNYLDVFYRENESWVQISKKLEHARYNQSTEPVEATDKVKLNDIWLNPDTQEYKIFMQTDESTKLWVKIEEAYLHTKFSGMVEPVNVEADIENGIEAVAVNMHDLWFKTSFDEFYIYSKGTSGALEWVKLDDFKTNATFKGEVKPDELKIGDLWYKHNKDDVYKGTMQEYQAQSYQFQWLSKEAFIRYANYVSEVLPPLESVKEKETCYKPFSQTLFIVEKKLDSEELEWKAYTFDTSNPTLTQSDEPVQNFNAYTKDPNSLHLKNPDYKPKGDNVSVYNDNKIYTAPQAVEEEAGEEAPEVVFNNKIVYFYPNGDRIDNPIHADTREVYTFNEQGVSQAKTDETFSGLHNAWVTSGQEKAMLKVGDVWSKDGAFYFNAKLVKEASFVALQESSVKPFAWVNFDNKRLDMIESLISPDIALDEAVKGLINPTYPQQLANVAYVTKIVNEAITKLKTDNSLV